MYEKAADAHYSRARIKDIEGLFTESHIELESVPKGLHRYEIGCSDVNGKPCKLARTGWANHYGTFLTNRTFKTDRFGRHDFEPESIVVSNKRMEIPAFLKIHSIQEVETYIAPACDHELCYRQSDNEKERGLVGYIHGDFGFAGKEFWHTWYPSSYPSSNESKNTPEFEEQLKICLDSLREYGPLKNFEAMKNFCGAHEEARISKAWQRSYAFRSYTQDYTFITRCSPIQDDAQFYIWCYDTKNLLRTRQKERQLPNICYAREKTEGLLVLIRYHGSLDIINTLFPVDEEQVAKLNSLLGVSKAQSAAMLSGYFAGWDLPTADARNYDEGGQFKLLKIKNPEKKKVHQGPER